ncbi:hypothetical protein [Chryseobacterium indoltheticum]|uniref:hypothetical protein n=1 Tax=Chryseobacterium indoltheticum TaxID=254 RepID=UPI003F4958B4
MAKTEKESNNGQNVKIAGLDVFLSHEILSFSNIGKADLKSEKPNSNQIQLHSSEYFSRIFHPPLV